MTQEIEPPVIKPRRSWKIGRVIRFFFRATRNTVFVVWLIIALITTTLSAAAWATYATWKVAQLTYQVGHMAYQHRKAMARAIAKARLRRLTVAIPVIGSAAAFYFERQTYNEWRVLYPEGTFDDYACDMATLTAEVLDDVLQELPETIRLSERRVSGFFPTCEQDTM